MWEKLKSFLRNDAAFYSVLILLVAGISFGLGQQSANWGRGEKTIENKGSIQVQAPVKANVVEAVETEKAQPLEVKPVPEVPSIQEVVGSKSGTKYHLPSCPGAKRIKPENLITFESVAAAKAAGYTAAANCPGLSP